MPANLIVGIVFSLLGGVFVLLAIFIFVRTQTFISKAQTITGRVIRLVYKTSSDGSSSYSPVFQFRTMAGQMIEVEDSMSSSPPMFSEGQSVEVLYDPANPNDARIKKISSLYFLPLLFGFMSFIFGGIGVGLLVSQAF